MLRLTYERMRLGWSKATLARRAKVDQALLSKIETGRVTPYPPELQRLTAALDFPESEATRLLDQVNDHGHLEN